MNSRVVSTVISTAIEIGKCNYFIFLGFGPNSIQSFRLVKIAPKTYTCLQTLLIFYEYFSECEIGVSEREFTRLVVRLVGRSLLPSLGRKRLFVFLIT